MRVPENSFTNAELMDLIHRQVEYIKKLQAVAEAARNCDRLLNEWDLIRQHSYAHEKLHKALAALDNAGENT
jgi:hypothetical protein